MVAYSCLCWSASTKTHCHIVLRGHARKFNTGSAGCARSLLFVAGEMALRR
jgi:hypothetical protein